MTCFGGKIGDLSGPGRCRIRPVYALSPGKFAPFIEVPWGECWVKHHRGVGSEPNSAFSFQGDLGNVASCFRAFVSSSVQRMTDWAVKIKLGQI